MVAVRRDKLQEAPRRGLLQMEAGPLKSGTAEYATFERPEIGLPTDPFCTLAQDKTARVP
jgi:hypothetical protein